MEPDQTQQQSDEQRDAQIEAKIEKQLAEWNEQEKIKVIKAQYPRMMKEFSGYPGKKPDYEHGRLYCRLYCHLLPV